MVAATGLVLIALALAPAASWRPPLLTPHRRLLPHIGAPRRLHSPVMASSSSLLAVEEAEDAVQLIANLTGVVDVDKCLPRLAGLLADAPTPFPAGDERHGNGLR